MVTIDFIVFVLAPLIMFCIFYPYWIGTNSYGAFKANNINKKQIDDWIPLAHKGDLSNENDLLVYNFIKEKIVSPFTLKDVKEKYGDIHYTVLDRLAADGKLIIDFIDDKKIFWLANGELDQKEITLKKLRRGIKENIDFEDFFYRIDSDNNEILYGELCAMLARKYGRPNAAYGSSKCKKRGNEWLDIHHISEIKDSDDNIAARTQSGELTPNSPENHPENLIYCNKVEHFILHYLIEDVRKGRGMGIHMIFGDILAFQSCKLIRGRLPQLQQVNSFFFTNFSWEQIKILYRRIIQKNYKTNEFKFVTNYYLFLQGSKIRDRALIVNTLYEIWS